MAIKYTEGDKVKIISEDDDFFNETAKITEVGSDELIGVVFSDGVYGLYVKDELKKVRK